MYEVIKLSNEKWDKLLELASCKDIHFTSSYLSCFEKHLKAECEMFIFKYSEGLLLYPFFKRKIPYYNDSFDIISPWYYGGYIITPDFDLKYIDEFIKTFEKYCNENNIISEFIYFHPYLENHKLLSKTKEHLKNIGEVVYVDIESICDKNIEEFFPSSSNRRNIRKYQYNNDIRIIFNNSATYLKSFYRIYSKSMEEKNAKDYVCFSYSFFQRLRDNLDNKFILLSLEYKNKIIASWIFLKQYDIAYYYLGAKDNNLDKVKSANRILYEAIKELKKTGIKILDLGGGNISLLNFKKSFSKYSKPKYISKKIFNEEKYEQLCTSEGIETVDIKGIDSDFFPEYKRSE